MSPLPQRKKTPEELAKLRESLGIPAGAESPEKPAATEEPKDPPPAPSPAEPKPVRSLRKSEQQPAPSPRKDARPGSRIPAHRHSDAELQEIRRQQALATMQSAAPDPKLMPARWFQVIPGYLLAIAGATCFIWREFPLAATAGCAVGALAVALAILMLRPLSRHHAAFIAMIALLVIVFGALHYFPQLRHAT